ncbi:hypothetical protein KQ307_13525 [Synechococcus sp. CS-1326]|uniref:hypothetical protein n=1 Tax=Synechococcus sp. CS-1326 TaxID=2847978 RepID=UPI00223B75F1|nr:hypothetical protein [Synechococcus sp. CS-1326]MCT0214503.1 hypothetical protein [Synechococcus sp. CS-1326]
MSFPLTALAGKWNWRWPFSWQSLLPVTTIVVASLILVPAVQLRRFPRSNAAGLERLLTASALIQSFAADPGREAPPLWQRRLGRESAARLWIRQRGSWWQFWGRHGDGAEAFLALPARAFGLGDSGALPPNGLRLDDLVVIAPDPLSRQLLQEDLRRNLRTPRGLQERCVQRLRSGQSVAWSRTALAQLAGPLSPLLQRYQQGCLELGSDGAGLVWQGESSSTEDLAGPSPALPPPPLLPSRRPALPASLLLEVKGERLDLLFQTLFTRQLIRQPLVERYGLMPPLSDRLGSLPFELRLRRLASGPFQASLELQLAVGKDRPAWDAWLLSLRTNLEGQGLTLQAPGAGVSSVPGSSTWQRQDGSVVGGWRWIRPVAGLPAELQFFLGPVPVGTVGSAAGVRSPDGVAISLQARPADLAAISLLPPGLPVVVRQAEQLEWLSVSPASKPAGLSPLSWLTGSLKLAQPSAGGGGRR